MNSPLIGIKELAQILELSEQQVRNLCRSGKIPSQKISDSWVIKKSDLDNILHILNREDHPSNYSREEIFKKNKPIALSFFSGAMGLDIGLEKAGFNVILACEKDKACRQTIQQNKPKIALINDIREYSAEQIKKVAGLNKRDDIDLIIGGPPCQAFSTAGNRQGFDDERGNVLLDFLDKIIELKPRFAVIENVRGILSAPLKHRPHNKRGSNYPPLSLDEERGGVLLYILNIISKAGYGISFNLYNSANFGTPQKRERVVIICSRDGSKLPYLIPTHSESGEYNLPQWRTFKDAVKDLPQRGHHHLEFPEKRLKYFRILKPGQYWKHLPKELQVEALGASYYAGGGKTGFLRRLAWDQPAPTLVTHPAMPATDLAHPTQNRPLSIEEYKRIQEFPDNWIITGNLIEQYRQVGNAVPASLGLAIGRLLMLYMKKQPIKKINGFPYSRYKNTDDISWTINTKKYFDKKSN